MVSRRDRYQTAKSFPSFWELTARRIEDPEPELTRTSTL